MIKKDELTHYDSCLNRAAADEPLFVLRAHDPSAPIIIRIWATLYESRKLDNEGVSLTPEQAKKYFEALKIARDMERWRDDAERHELTGVDEALRDPPI